MNPSSDQLKSCPFCGSAAKAVERNNPMSKWRWSVDCASTTCGVSGPVEATKFEAVEAWNRHSAPNAADPTGEVEEAEFVRLSDVLNLVSNWWATEDGYIAMSPFDARLHLEKHFRSAATVGNSMEALERLKAIIDWADLALKFPSEFDSHGVNLLNGPVFDAARALLSAALSVQPAAAVVGEPWGEVRRGTNGDLAIFSPKFSAVKARFTAGSKNSLKAGTRLYADAAPSAPEGWQPIETAPKGPEILLFEQCDEMPATWVGRWFDPDFEDGYWTDTFDLKVAGHPTHWRPLPAPPALGGASHD